MNHYLIEFRFRGYAKKYLKERIFEVAKKFRVKGVTKKHVVPHITLFGPFTTTDERKVASTFLSVCKRYDLMTFQLKGFGNFDNRVIYVDINPSEELKKFRRELSKEITGLRNFLIFRTVKTKGITDFEESHAFHATIAFKDIERKFQSILMYLKNKHVPHIDQRLLRVTLLRNGRILYEYDFLQKRAFNRREALNKHFWRKTINLLKNGKN
ncbi:MAG: 2'-5' RNA ligase family protein [Nanoarchaeota archaeon]